MGQQPDLNKIDEEIRPLIHLLNKAPYIQTHACCFGHPNNLSRRWTPGWIAILPIVDFCSFWEFLNGLHVQLNCPSERPFELFQQVHDDALFSSATPLLDVYCRFSLGADFQRNDIHVWNHLINATQEFLQEAVVQDKKQVISVKTAAEGADFLTDKLHSTPHVQPDRTKFIRGYCVYYRATWSYDSCKWCWDLVEHVNKQLGKILGEYDWLHALYSGRNSCDQSCNRRRNRTSFRARAIFDIRPIIRINTHDVTRTREEHLQIWRLIELISESLMMRLLRFAPPKKGE